MIKTIQRILSFLFVNGIVFISFVFYLIHINIAKSFVTELSSDISYQKQTYGSMKKNIFESQTYSGSVAFYFWNNTALEFNYSKSVDVLTDNNEILITGYTLKQSRAISTTNTETGGIGIRQSFGSRRSAFRPTISIGYARKIDSSYNVVDYLDTSSSTKIIITSKVRKNLSNSMFATIAFNIQLTKLLALRISTNTVFEAFKFKNAKDYMKYSAGFTWYL